MSSFFQQRRARWAAALRSGDYVQARGRLKIQGNGGTPTYCCLGVACELAIQDGVDVQWVGEDADPDIAPENAMDSWGFKTSSLGDAVNYGDLPPAVASYYGITSMGALIEPIWWGDSGRAIDLVRLNDRAHYSFEQIAEQVERNLATVDYK